MSIPAMGLGTWLNYETNEDPSMIYNAVQTAYQIGYPIIQSSQVDYEADKLL